MVARDVVHDSTIQGGFGVVRPLQGSCAFGSVGPSLCYCPECVGLHDDLFAFGVDPLSLFLLVASGLPAFYRALLRAWTTFHGSLSRLA